MKKVTIKENERGLVFKKDVLTQVSPQGSYWFFGGERISIFNVFEEFPEIEQRIFEHTLLKDHLEIVEVKADELALVFERSLLKEILEPGKIGRASCRERV